MCRGDTQRPSRGLGPGQLRGEQRNPCGVVGGNGDELGDRTGQMLAQQKRGRAVLLLFGLIRFRWRRYRCRGCGVWRCPAAEGLELAAKQRMTRTLHEVRQKIAVGLDQARRGELLDGEEVFRQLEEPIGSGS